ncbi:uncharacterized protein LOC134311996 [Trichomycterus rosablanca]|uniref:uncharacterized protein LOC134311996 n=1 Tax=Trichomycterus rosablanca TaxID=2290929 RepID=UPI002F35195E
MASTFSVAQNEFSCSVCLDTLNDPVTLLCGHSFCMVCINNCWDREDDKGTYSCPQCRQTFTPRPAVRKNIILAEVLENLKKTELQAPQPVHSSAEPEDVECDSCTGTKYKAVKSCLVCLTSYCETHLQPHYESPAFKTHTLVKATRRLQEQICFRHNKSLEVYCCTDQQCICMLCTMDDHKGHDTISAAAERTEKQKQLLEVQRKFQEKIQNREKELNELINAVESHKFSAQTAVENIQRICTELIDSIMRRFSEMKELIRDREKTEVSQAENVIKQLKQEIVELERKNDGLAKLSQTVDPIHFLQSFRSLSTPAGSAESPTITISPFLSFDDVTESVSQLREKVEEFWEEQFKKIPDEVKVVQILPPEIREDFLQYFCQFTLDPNTVHNYLDLSEENKVVTNSGTKKSYSNHPDRFDWFFQFLCRESVSRCCYWEVEWNGNNGVDISVSYKSIRRKGSGTECVFGGNDQSWKLFCSPSSFSFWHNNKERKIPIMPSSSRIGVYVDYRAGTLSFYSVSDTMKLLHRVQTKFTQPLYPGILVYSGTKVKLSDLDVILDPDTANCNLILSNDGKQVKHGDKRQNLPDNPKRFNSCPCVLGKQGFSTGRFYYVVQRIRYVSLAEWVKVTACFSYSPRVRIRAFAVTPVILSHYTGYFPAAQYVPLVTVPKIFLIKVMAFQILRRSEPQTREDFLQYFCRFTLDPNTAHQSLRLSEENKVVTWSETEQPYPDHPDRFDCYSQVLCRESVTGRCYWEVECSGCNGVDVAVSYKSISRKGEGCECVLGYNNQSWYMYCSPTRFVFRHNTKETKIPIMPSSSRIGVYVDYRAGTLSFYSISDTMKLLHRVQTTFTQPLYPGFSVNPGSTVQILPPPTREDFLQYFCVFTLDPNTVNKNLLLSAGNKVATRSGTEQLYPDHPDRFDWYPQVLCRESVTGRCYWEVECSGSNGVDIAVSYKSISRKGEGCECVLGYNNQSWYMYCSPTRFVFRHNTKETHMPSSSRIGVYVDYRAGTLSFYSVSDTMKLLHRVQTTFTQPLYPGFSVNPGSTVQILPPETRGDFLQYFCVFTLDPNTVNKNLLLSGGNKVATWSGTEQWYPDHPDRFDCYPQVMCRESVSGRCYWEVEYSGSNGVDIAVSYKSISRKGEGYERMFAFNNQSWYIYCTPTRFVFRHNTKETKIPIMQSSSRIGVYVDYRAGTLSFYSISDTMKLLHRVQTTFTQLLYPGFRVNPGSTVQIVPPPTREDFLQYFCRFTLDPNTVNKYLSLSEENKVVTCSGTDQSYPDHPDRFDHLPQVLCRESVCGRSYWEVELTEDCSVDVAVSYKSISRKGDLQSHFGYNNLSWYLYCSPGLFVFRHNHNETEIRPVPTPCRIGVYVDYRAGTLSYYCVSDTMKLLHRVQTKFTQPLYPGFKVNGSKVKLSDHI